MMSGPDVRAAQEKLAVFDYITEIDGVFGFGTERAVKNFQRAKGLKQTGVIGKVTRRHLRLGEFHA